MTPPVDISYVNPETGRWQVRVFANKFPALAPSENPAAPHREGLFFSFNGTGVHEVIVETPVHNLVMALQNDTEIQMVLHAYRERYRTISRMPFVRLVVIFKNYGLSAGTSLAHPHSQLIATPVVPESLRREYDTAAKYYDACGRCLFADILEQELTDGERIVMETGEFVVFQPFASHKPYETWIIPRSTRAGFGETPDEELDALAPVIRTTLLKLYRGLDNPDFNYIIQSVPVGEEEACYYRWHVRILPRLTQTAGFELGTGIDINPAPPEETAALLRDVKTA